MCHTKTPFDACENDSQCKISLINQILRTIPSSFKTQKINTEYGVNSAKYDEKQRLFSIIRNKSNFTKLNAGISLPQLHYLKAAEGAHLSIYFSKIALISYY